MNNFKLLLDNLGNKNHLILASHNFDTILELKNYIDSNKLNSSNILFAQLQGLADHVSFYLQQNGLEVYKCVPFGETHIMIPYFIRRAQESFQVLSVLNLQQKLIKDELFKRTPFST